jgi:hypothetical protein
MVRSIGNWRATLALFAADQIAAKCLHLLQGRQHTIVPHFSATCAAPFSDYFVFIACSSVSTR